MIYAVDLDGTLCYEMKDWKDYKIAPPIYPNINKSNKLFNEGHIIVIYTARPITDIYVTRSWLKKHSVKYHKLIMDKFRADWYIDNNSMKMEDL
uniref:FCP1 homology domain-containing protein n=1 Tax=viral metagenome TaxID=1070528 RepID=A0A6M3KJV1_9ZZZZ